MRDKQHELGLHETERARTRLNDDARRRGRTDTSQLLRELIRCPIAVIDAGSREEGDEGGDGEHDDDG